MLEMAIESVENITIAPKVSTGVDGKWKSYLMMAVLSGAFLLPIIRTFWGIGDEAISIEGAKRVLQGQIPSHDFFEAIGPGESYWIAGFYKVFGTNITVSRLLLLATGIGLTLLMQRIAQGAGLRVAWYYPMIFTVIAIPQFPVTSYHWDSDLFSLSAFAFFLAWVHRPHARLALLSGLCLGATTMLMQQKGLLLSGGLIASAFLARKDRWKSWMAIMIAAWLFIPLVVIGYYVWNGVLNDLVWANYLWPARHYLHANRCGYGASLGFLLEGWREALAREFPQTLSGILAQLAGIPLYLVVSLPALLMLLVLVLRKEAFSPALVPFWLCGTALWISEFQRMDLPHLIWGCPILFVLVFTLLAQLPRTWRWWRGPVFVGTGLLALFELMPALACKVPVPGRAGTLYSTERNEALHYLVNNTQRGENVFIFPYGATLNFLSDTQNPTRYTYFLHGMHTICQFREVVKDLESKQVRLALWDTHFSVAVWKRLFPAYQEPPRSEQIIESYLQSHYRQVAQAGTFQILVRK